MNRMETAEKLVERARKLGADEAEAYVQTSTSVEIRVQMGQAETVNYQERCGFGIRVLKDGRLGFASSNNMELSAAEELIVGLISNTEKHTFDEHNILPDPVPGAMDDRSFEQFDEAIITTPIETKIQKALAIEKAVLNADKRISHTAWLQYGDGADEYAIVSSRGVAGEARRTDAYGYAMAVAMENSASGHPDPETAQTGNGIDVKTAFSELNPEFIGNKAARFALRMLGAKDGHTGEVEAVFPPETGYSFIDLMAQMLSADLVQKKKSLFTNKLGKTVASEMVTIIDDGRLPGGLGSSAVDGEGVPTSTKEIIKSGRLVQLLYDSYTAHRGNTQPTGNADRGSFNSRPMISPTNFYLKPGDMSPNKIIAAIQKGLFVTEVSGLHASVDPVTGNFSIPCKGLLINHGETGQPVGNITISGNIFSFLKNIDAIADNLSWEVMSNVIGVPTYKVSGMKVSGK